MNVKERLLIYMIHLLFYFEKDFHTTVTTISLSESEQETERNYVVEMNLDQIVWVKVVIF